MARLRDLQAMLLMTLGCASTGPSELDQLDLAEARWERSGPADYRFETRIVCFCPPDYADWHAVTVNDGAIVALVNLTTQVSVPANRWNEWDTVDRMFDRIREFIDSAIFGRVEATYHPVLGFPEEVNMVAREGVADAGLLIEVRAFEVAE